MTPTKLTPAQLKDHELIKIHKSLLIKKLEQEDVTLKSKNYILRYYDMVINTDNIRNYYNRHINIFLSALINNQLDKIANSF